MTCTMERSVCSRPACLASGRTISQVVILEWCVAVRSGTAPAQDVRVHLATMHTQLWVQSHTYPTLYPLLIVLSLAGAIAVTMQFYGSSPLPVVLSDVACSAEQNALLECAASSSTCLPQAAGAGVVCQAPSTQSGNCSDGDIRLMNGSTVLEGRVEICINNAWGTVCDRTFSEDEANVICGQTASNFNGTVQNPVRAEAILSVDVL